MSLLSTRLGQAARRSSLIFASCVLLSCGGAGGNHPDQSLVTKDWVWSLPAHFATPKEPADNPMSKAKVALGRLLFYDKRLSGNGAQSCGSCHDQSKAFTDGRAVAQGSTGEATPRNSQHLSNLAWNATLTWANISLVTLERQMENPLFGEGPVEMGVNDQNKELILQKLQADATYVSLFKTAFPQDPAPVNWGNIIKAIASFERSMVSSGSAYDAYLQGQDTLSPAEERGRQLFFSDQAQCSQCHGGFNFNDQVVTAASTAVTTPFHNTGLYNLAGTGAFPEPNRGVFELTGKASDMGKFRAPSLRNVEVTGPYMHDGSVATLEDVLRFYAGHGRNVTTGVNAGDGRLNPFKSALVDRITLSDQDQADVIAFLKALTDPGFLSDPRFSDPFAANP